MQIGASSACFYPLETEKSFLRLAKLGFTESEIFFNSVSELEPSFIKELKAIRDAYGMNIISFHPYESFAEGYRFFSRYERRFYDSVEGFKRYFEAAAELGAKYLVLHGSKGKIDIPKEEYAERFGRLNETAEAFGCTVAHENVVDYSGATPEFMQFMKSQLGSRFKMVLDVKQARRAKVDPYDFIRIMGDDIVHVHLSDFSENCDCLPPSEKGLFDFERLFTELDKVGYKGKYIVELYSDNYNNETEILTSAKYLEGILNKINKG